MVIICSSKWLQCFPAINNLSVSVHERHLSERRNSHLLILWIFPTFDPTTVAQHSSVHRQFICIITHCSSPVRLPMRMGATNDDVWSIKYISNICIVVVYWFKCGVKANLSNWVVGAFVIVLCILPAQQVPIQEEYRIINAHGSLYIIYWDWNHTHAAAYLMSIYSSFRLGALARAMGPPNNIIADQTNTHDHPQQLLIKPG